MDGYMQISRDVNTLCTGDWCMAQKSKAAILAVPHGKG